MKSPKNYLKKKKKTCLSKKEWKIEKNSCPIESFKKKKKKGNQMKNKKKKVPFTNRNGC